MKRLVMVGLAGLAIGAAAAPADAESPAASPPPLVAAAPAAAPPATAGPDVTMIRGA